VRTDAVDRRGGPLKLIEAAPLLARIVEAWHPYQIWLFGSRARGEANEESDWDLLVVVPDEVSDEEIDPLVVWRLKRESGVRADVIMCRLQEFLEDYRTVNTLEYEAATRGVLIYEC
jgi:predicted nucleotidyltransferase